MKYNSSRFLNFLKHYLVQFLAILGVVFLVFLVWIFAITRQISFGGDAEGGLLSRGKSKAKMFLPSQVKVTFNDVAGAYEAKQELLDVIDFLRDPEKYKRLGCKVPRGILITGEPGNGKTLLAKAVAGEANCPFFNVVGSEFVEMFVGVGASRVRDLFNEARKHSPCIVFIDEIDAIGRKRGTGVGSGNDEREQTLNQLLTEMDGFEEYDKPVIIIGATNIPEVLDKALVRAGRFDRKVHVAFPDLAARLELCNIHSKKVVLGEGIDLEKIARATPGFSGADLANMMNEASINAAKKNAEYVVLADIEEARDKIIMGKEARHKVMTPEELKMTAYHEAGHALIRLLLPDSSEPLYKVTIIPRGPSLGATHWLPERDKYVTYKEELLSSITSALGGRVAEDLVFGRISTGASDDLLHATEMAKSMVCEYGMSDVVGPRRFISGDAQKPECSEEMAKKIDTEIEAILTQCFESARKILSENRDKLDKLAMYLLEKETAEATEIYDLLGLAPRVTHSLRS